MIIDRIASLGSSLCRSGPPGNLSRRGFLLAGAAAGGGLVAIGDGTHEPAAASPSSPQRHHRSETSSTQETRMNLFPGFSAETVETSGTTIRVLRKGTGRPLLLIHGYPETHLTWHKVAPQLAEHFSVFVPDLRGYGDSGKPADGDRHDNYSFHAMAQDQVDVMRHYGHERFLVAAHDRGARATHRLCLEHPQQVEKACIMDIAPTLTMYEGTNQEFATQYMWWFFLIQPAPLPEHMIGLDPAFYFRGVFAELNKTPGSIAPDLMDRYMRIFSNPAAIHASCENFRAAAGIDLDRDKADDKAGRKIQCPLHVLWAGKGTVGKVWDVLAVWRAKCAGPVTGKPLDCGHFLQEERPQEVLAELHQFFG